ncbi:MAG: succinate dehydrogenase, cytochrome b556 subunit [Rhodospirillales bacterium RIFCSPLOWO2_12_FULL_58_28]|nr:MAG: succinate dehydrogenase, cytochrome b556 subunit [Rhodospirillales bacterium RIFCSPLOWO2_02_FULL_58_16]OHC76869.1 MAG: succinate dehydrogenase, cytochrome b556 subunit [Rhodospirillales bacterium RIFCSPLOWO2_12_FULL_58_28]
MPRENRPMSPHLQVYAFKLHMAISIFHRITGVALAFGVVALIYWLAAAAYGPESFARAQAVFGSWFGYLCLFGWSACLFYHLCNGIRHLFWDIGWGFAPRRVTATGKMVLAGTVALTALSWAIGIGM